MTGFGDLKIKPKNSINLGCFDIYERLKFHAQLS